METETLDLSAFRPLYRDCWGPQEMMIALAIGCLHRMPERFRREDVFAPARRCLARFVRNEPLPNSAEFPIAHVRFDGEKIVPRDGARKRLHEEDVRSDTPIYFDADYNCYIAFEDAGVFSKVWPLLECFEQVDR